MKIKKSRSGELKPEYAEMEKKQSILDRKLINLRNPKHNDIHFFITDEGGEIISEGYKSKALAEKFIPILRFSTKEKLKIIEMRVDIK